MTTIHQWLEGKIQPHHNDSYRAAIRDVQKDLPSLLYTMEAELCERIGGETEYTEIEDEIGIRAFNRLVGRNEERRRIHTIVHSYFNPQE